MVKITEEINPENVSVILKEIDKPITIDMN